VLNDANRSFANKLASEFKNVRNASQSPHYRQLCLMPRQYQASVVNNPAEVAEQATTIVTMLPAGYVHLATAIASRCLSNVNTSRLAFNHDQLSPHVSQLTCICASPEVRTVYAEILAVAKPGALLLDASTVDVDTAVAVGEQATALDMDWLDCPVSGGKLVIRQHAMWGSMLDALDRFCVVVVRIGSICTSHAKRCCQQVLVARQPVR
jgi:3-hydroxyisobutyrate dehydrogenase-like beta-hydroxyacid dehydrogenase